MEPLEAMNLVTGRRTVRRYSAAPVDRVTLDQLLEAARWAPSGLNNQPWRFVTVEDKQNLEALAKLTKYGKVVRGAPAAIAVFLDTASVYNRTKDVQGIGAAIENILLAAHGMGLGACWLGEILNRREEVEAALNVPPGLELMALITVGWQDGGAKEGSRDRQPLENLIVARR